MSPDEFPFMFACRRSGNCCARPGGIVRVDSGEITQLAGHLGIVEAVFRARYVAASGDRLLDGFGGRCVFLEEGPQAACRVHPARPQQCRDWPFWPELRSDAVALREAMRFCPGIQLRDGQR